MQTDQWWKGVTLPLLQLVRLRLRDLVEHIGKTRRRVLYTDFADEIGEETEHDLPQVGAVDFVRFKQRARAFLRQHEDHITLHKLRQGKPLNTTDLGELEGMLLDAGIGDADDIERARAVSDGFGRFVRSLVGLDRAAVSGAFGEFVAEGTATREQLEFIGLVVDQLTSQGVIEPKMLYESPFTDVAPQRPDRLFDEASTVRLFAGIEALNRSAVA